MHKALAVSSLLVWVWLTKLSANTFPVQPHNCTIYGFLKTMTLLPYDPPPKQQTKKRSTATRCSRNTVRVVVAVHVVGLGKQVLLTITLWMEPQKT